METTIYNIRKGHEFYSVSGEKINKYQYLCIYPSPNPKYETPENYHIVINKFTERPERWYYTNLQKALANDWAYSYENAKAELKHRKKKELEDILENFDKYY